MNTVEAIETLNKHKDKKSSLPISFKHGDSVTLLNGLIEIEIDLEYHSNRALLRFKAPRFVDIFRIKKSQ